MLNLNMVNSKFHLIQNFGQTVFATLVLSSYVENTQLNTEFHLFRRNTLLMNDFEFTMPNLYLPWTFQPTAVN